MASGAITQKGVSPVRMPGGQGGAPLQPAGEPLLHGIQQKGEHGRPAQRSCKGVQHVEQQVPHDQEGRDRERTAVEG